MTILKKNNISQPFLETNKTWVVTSIIVKNNLAYVANKK